MPRIMKVSALQNYTEVLERVTLGEGRYAIIDIDEYESLKQS